MLACTLALLLLVNVVLGCPPGWQYFDGSCYKFGASERSFVGEPTTATWSDARLVCLSLGGDLVSVHTPAENAFVHKNSFGDTWIGYTEDRSGVNPPFRFQWTDGTSTSYDYMNWAHKQPHYPANDQRSVGCAYFTKGTKTRRRRVTGDETTGHTYGQPGQWYTTSHCSSVVKRYVCKRPACCYDMAVAVADLVPNTDVEVSGTVTFQQNTLGGATIVKGVVKGLNPLSKHGFHIHTSSDKSHACQSYGGHYNPYGRSHGGPQDQNRHIGDLGNIVADENGVASFTLHEKLVSLIGSTTVLGRGVVVHAGEDDLGRGDDAGSLTTGNAGGRLACGPIICRTCFDTLAATAGIKSDDGTNHGHLEFFQEYRVGFTEQMVSLQSIISTGSYNYGEFAAIKHEEYVKQGKQCAAIFTSGMLNGSVDQEWDLTIEGNKVQRRSFSNGPIKSLVGKVVAYRLSQRTTNGDVTQSVTLCGTVWPTPYEKCACVILRTKTGTCGELCFGQQTCGGLVSIEGKIDQTCLSDANNVAGFSTMDYAIPTDQCLDAYVTQIIELPLQRDSDGTALICTKSSGPSLREPGSLAGRTFLVHDSDGDPVACGVTEYRATCPKSHC